jgi:hypothetical protein
MAFAAYGGIVTLLRAVLLFLVAAPSAATTGNAMLMNLIVWSTYLPVYIYGRVFAFAFCGGFSVGRCYVRYGCVERFEQFMSVVCLRGCHVRLCLLLVPPLFCSLSLFLVSVCTTGIFAFFYP